MTLEQITKDDMAKFLATATYRRLGQAIFNLNEQWMAEHKKCDDISLNKKMMLIEDFIELINAEQERRTKIMEWAERIEKLTGVEQSWNEAEFWAIQAGDITEKGTIEYCDWL